jgi:hypothetical protein
MMRLSIWGPTARVGEHPTIDRPFAGSAATEPKTLVRLATVLSTSMMVEASPGNVSGIASNGIKTYIVFLLLCNNHVGEIPLRP